MATQVQAGFTPQDTVCKVELSLRCTNLKDLDVFSKSDPVVFLYERSSPSAGWSKLGRTEVIDNNLNPEVNSELSYLLMRLSMSVRLPPCRA